MSPLAFNQPRHSIQKMSGSRWRIQSRNGPSLPSFVAQSPRALAGTTTTCVWPTSRRWLNTLWHESGLPVAAPIVCPRLSAGNDVPLEHTVFATLGGRPRSAEEAKPRERRVKLTVGGGPSPRIPSVRDNGCSGCEGGSDGPSSSRDGHSIEVSRPQQKT
uniref:Uncharacterized protein n=1 Tax=Mycena chlorophos TaxID=658473 RepID=A0ABQ0L4I5_MYCCL|nr:predicted protein [Mycena chlorophos]